MVDRLIGIIGLLLAILVPALQSRYPKLPKNLVGLGLVASVALMGWAVATVLVASPGPDLPAPPQIVSPADAKILREMTRNDFVALVTKLTLRMRELDAAYGNEQARIIDRATPMVSYQDKDAADRRWADMMNREDTSRARLNFEWQTKYRARSRATYEELCRRLGMVTDEFPAGGNAPGNQAEAGMLLMTGTLAGTYPISALADLLDSLTRQLN
jgi:hypothetical protein